MTLAAMLPATAQVNNNTTQTAVASQAAVQTITGRVVDTAGQPIPYANVVLLSMPDSAFVKGAVTMDDGSFSLEARCDGGIIRVSSIGYREATVPCPGTDAGTITMQDDTQLLGEVEVTGHMPQYRQGAEGLQTNIEGTVLSKLNTAEDVLSHIPTVTKTKDGWEVFGKGTPIIYVNGRKLQDLSELDNLKAGDVKSVEVIRNPGARYDASVNAVIRIKTVRLKGEGLGADLRTNYTYNGYANVTEQANLTWQRNGLNLFATYRYYNRKGHELTHNSTVARTDTLWQQAAYDHARVRFERHYLQGGASYDIDADNSVGARYSANLTGYDRYKGIYASDVTANGAVYDRLLSNNVITESNKPTHRANLYYNGKIGSTQVDFNTDLYFATNITTAVTDEHSEEMEPAQVVNRSSATNSMVASKLVLTSPLLGGNVTYGAEYIDTHHKDVNTISGTTLIGNSDDKLKEQTMAPFLEYSHALPFGQLSAGLRYEHVRYRYYEGGAYQPEQSRSYSNLYPSASLATQLGKVGLQFSYSVKTQRPTYSQLSSATTYANRFIMQTGNPRLRNETQHNIELGGTWKFLQFSVGYQDRRNAIIYWMDQMEGHEAVTVINYVNRPSVKTLTAFASVAPKLGIWSPQYSVSMQKPWFSFSTQSGRYTFNKPLFVFTLNNAFSLPWGLTANVDFYSTSRGYSENVRLARAEYNLNASIRKSFMDDALTFEVSGSNLLGKMASTSEIRSANTTFHQWRPERSSVSFTLRYKFNAGKNKYRGTGAGNDAINRM